MYNLTVATAHTYTIGQDQWLVHDGCHNEAYETAKAGGQHSGTLDNYQDRSNREIEKSLTSYEAQVQEHQVKIDNPAQYADDWTDMDPREQQGLIGKWLKDVKRNQALADIMRGILRDRGE